MQDISNRLMIGSKYLWQIYSKRLGVDMHFYLCVIKTLLIRLLIVFFSYLLNLFFHLILTLVFVVQSQKNVWLTHFVQILSFFREDIVVNHCQGI